MLASASLPANSRICTATNAPKFALFAAISAIIVSPVQLKHRSLLILRWHYLIHHLRLFFHYFLLLLLLHLSMPAAATYWTTLEGGGYFFSKKESKSKIAKIESSSNFRPSHPSPSFQLPKLIFRVAARIRHPLNAETDYVFPFRDFTTALEIVRTAVMNVSLEENKN